MAALGCFGTPTFARAKPVINVYQWYHVGAYVSTDLALHLPDANDFSSELETI